MDDFKTGLLLLGSITAVSVIGLAFESLTSLRFVHWLAYAMFVAGALFAGFNMWYAGEHDRSMENYNREIRDAAFRGDVKAVEAVSREVRQSVQSISKSATWAGGLMLVSGLLLKGSDWWR